MTTTKVGMREFRAGLANYIDADAPVAVTRHGQTVGYFIPTRSERQADAASLRAAAEKLDALLDIDDVEVDGVVDEFRRARRAATA